MNKQGFMAASAKADFLDDTDGSRLCLYEQLAQLVANDIEQGIYQSGQKIPSIRQLSQQCQVSTSTVGQAYALLEDRGVIYAKPQSGYFVRFGVSQYTPSSSVSIGECPVEVTKGKLIKQILDDCQSPATINFGAAIPEMALLPHRSIQNHMQKALRFQHVDCLRYQLPPGYAPLRLQLSQRMRQLNIRCHPDDIVITQGCTEAISLSLMANTRKGDTIAVESPCYYGYYQMAADQGLKVIEIPTDPVTGMSIEALRLALQEWPLTLVIVSSRCSNPMGATFTQDKQKAFVELINRYQINAIDDDTNGDLNFGDHQQTTLKTFDTEGRVLYCSSFSKMVSPGLRLGWCIPGRCLDRLKNHQVSHTFASTSMTQCAVASYLASGQHDKHLRRTGRLINDNMKRFTRCINDWFPEGTRLHQPSGGFVLWLRLPVGIDTVDLQQQAKAHAISIVPGTVFSNTPHFNHYCRINCAIIWTPAVRDALKLLGRIANDLNTSIK